MRKIFIIAASLAALVIPTAAFANVAVDNGVGHVDKSDVQAALKWNNAAFDKNVGSLVFTANASKVIDYSMTCLNGETGEITSGGHRTFTQSGTATLTPTALLSSNGKQITGWNLSGSASAFTGTGSTVSSKFGCAEGSIVWMQELVNPTATVLVTGGLKVNNVDLPITPVVIPAV